MSSTTQLISLPSISLFFKQGASNKIYQVQIVNAEPSGYKINFQFGRVGNKLSSGTKTTCPVDFEVAKKIYDQLVQDKVAKGYTPAEGGVPYQGSDKEKEVSGINPQLLNFIEAYEVQGYINDDTWIMQEKKDGVRCMIKYDGKGNVQGVSKKGLNSSLPQSVCTAIANSLGAAKAVLDGELVGEVYWMFDLLSIGVHAIAPKGCRARLAEIQDWITETSDNFRIVPTAIGKANKKALYAQLKKDNAEGFVFKKADAPYSVGRPASKGNWLKFKFYASATVRVRCQNDQRSVQMEVLSKGAWTYVGSVTIPVNREMPKAGAYIEVGYLYAFPGGSIFQASYLGERDDVDEESCLMSQLKYKRETETQE